jgi:phage anti-repressor protein
MAKLTLEQSENFNNYKSNYKEILKIMKTNLIRVNVENQTVLGRDLHEFLEVETRYDTWITRMIEYGFVEKIDYIAIAQKRATNNPKNPWTTSTNHQLNLSMAKEISMIQRTPKGKEARLYFIKCEEELKDKSPSHLIQDSIERAKAWILEEEARRKLALENKQKQVLIETANELIKPQKNEKSEMQLSIELDLHSNRIKKPTEGKTTNHGNACSIILQEIMKERIEPNQDNKYYRTGVAKLSNYKFNITFKKLAEEKIEAWLNDDNNIAEKVKEGRLYFIKYKTFMGKNRNLLIYTHINYGQE